MNSKKQAPEEREPCVCCGQMRPSDMLDRNRLCRLCSDSGHTSPLCKEGTEACKTCNGTGSYQGTDCPKCGGSGKDTPAPQPSGLTSLEEHHLILGIGEDGFFDKSRDRLEAVQEAIARTEARVLEKKNAEIDALKTENALLRRTVEELSRGVKTGVR